MENLKQILTRLDTQVGHFKSVAAWFTKFKAAELQIREEEGVSHNHKVSTSQVSYFCQVAGLSNYYQIFLDNKIYRWIDYARASRR